MLAWYWTHNSPMAQSLFHQYKGFGYKSFLTQNKSAREEIAFLLFFHFSNQEQNRLIYLIAEWPDLPVLHLHTALTTFSRHQQWLDWSEKFPLNEFRSDLRFHLLLYRHHQILRLQSSS